MSNGEIILKPQAGPQEKFLSSSADFVIYGGAAGGGKTFALLLEPLRHISNPNFSAIIFRQSNPQIKNPGGLWDESKKIYPYIGAIFKGVELEWVFPSGARVVFEHLGETEYQQNSNVSNFQGSQIPLICFDELTHFCRSAVFYLLSRNRSTCGVKPYIRATCNPDADSWVAEFIRWWLNDEGYAIHERSGVIRYFCVVDDIVYWADTRNELLQQFPDSMPLSFTFISASLNDNKILMEADAGYLAKLKALPLVERERLLGGNWKIKHDAGNIFKKQWFEIVKAVPANPHRVIRRWDLAATKDKGDYTVGLKLAKYDGLYYVLDVVRFKGSSAEVEQAIINTALQDGYNVEVGLPQDPGQAGKFQREYLTTKLAGFIVSAERETGDKATRAMAVASQSEVGNVKLLIGSWNDAFLNELENFTGDPKAFGHDDQVDALSGAFNMLLANNVRVGFV